MKPNPGRGNKATNGGNNGKIKPPIPLIFPEEDKKSPEDTLKFELEYLIEAKGFSNI